MSGHPGRFRPDELSDPGRGATDPEQAAALAAARELEQALPGDAVRPSADFSERVMAALASEPAPRPVGFLARLHVRPGIAGLIASVQEAWAVAARGAGRPLAARGMALAYVLAIVVLGVSLTGVAAMGTVGALGLLSPDRTPASSIVSPEPLTSPSISPLPSVSEPTDSEAPGETIEPSESPGASESEGPDGATGGGSGSTPTATATHKPENESSGSPKPSASDDHAGDGSPAPSEDSGGASWPSASPRPSGTPRASLTP
jgi:hypothetical protein